MRLVKLLKNASYNDFKERTLEEITKFCYHCQLNSSAPRQFKFTLKDDRHFNYEILVDVMYLGNRPVQNIVDASTAFQGAKFLSAISAKETWQALRMLWIDTYQGPPDILTRDAGTNIEPECIHSYFLSLVSLPTILFFYQCFIFRSRSPTLLKECFSLGR
jgi:hypothetical protein